MTTLITAGKETIDVGAVSLFSRAPGYNTVYELISMEISS